MRQAGDRFEMSLKRVGERQKTGLRQAEAGLETGMNRVGERLKTGLRQAEDGLEMLVTRANRLHIFMNVSELEGTGLRVSASHWKQRTTETFWRRSLQDHTCPTTRPGPVRHHLDNGFGAVQLVPTGRLGVDGGVGVSAGVAQTCPLPPEEAAQDATLQRLQQCALPGPRVSEQLQLDPGLDALRRTQLLDVAQLVVVLKPEEENHRIKESPTLV